MKQKELIALVRGQIVAGLARYGITDLPVKQGYQPVTQGRVTRCVYFWMLPTTPIGEQSRSYATNPTTLQLQQTETQNLATSFQIGALIPDDPTDDAQQTAMDITILCHQIVKSQPFIRAMTAANAGIRDVTTIRNPQFVNEFDQFEYNPSFDFTVTHKQSIMQLTDSIDAMEFNLYRV